jgi:hypothetical protein
MKKVEAMETYSSHGDNRREEWLSWSCWGRLKLMLPWTRRKRGHQMQKNTVGCSDCASNIFKSNRQRPLTGTFRYSPLSYAQNFDEWVEDNEDSSLVGFSSRFAAPSSITHSEGK